MTRLIRAKQSNFLNSIIETFHFLLYYTYILFYGSVTRPFCCFSVFQWTKTLRISVITESELGWCRSTTSKSKLKYDEFILIFACLWMWKYRYERRVHFNYSVEHSGCVRCPPVKYKSAQSLVLCSSSERRQVLTVQCKFKRCFKEARCHNWLKIFQYCYKKYWFRKYRM